MFRRFFDEGLAQSSYLLACDRTRLAVVIDPRRDIDEYVETAVRQGLTITHAIETHVHADFVSGARELAERGATVVAGPGAGLRFAHQEVAEGTTLRVGALDLEVAHTPGHTPEHITILGARAGRAGESVHRRHLVRGRGRQARSPRRGQHAPAGRGSVRLDPAADGAERRRGSVAGARRGLAVWRRHRRRCQHDHWARAPVQPARAASNPRRVRRGRPRGSAGDAAVFPAG